VLVLGSGGPELDDGRASARYLVQLDGCGWLPVDFGSGAAYSFERAGACIADLDAVLLTHLHLDHGADIPALVKTSYFSGPDRDLPVYGRAGYNFMPFPDAWPARLRRHAPPALAALSAIARAPIRRLRGRQERVPLPRGSSGSSGDS
jgi:ribonuclease BN (tRNA processing enzyme)